MSSVDVSGHLGESRLRNVLLTVHDILPRRRESRAYDHRIRCDCTPVLEDDRLTIVSEPLHARGGDKSDLPSFDEAEEAIGCGHALVVDAKAPEQIVGIAERGALRDSEGRELRLTMYIRLVNYNTEVESTHSTLPQSPPYCVGELASQPCGMEEAS